MPVQPIIPPEWGWAYDIAVGQDWPQADEDALRRLAQAWTDAMEALLTVADGGNAAAQNVNYSVQSVSSDEFNNYWSAYVDGDNSVVGQMARQCEGLATQLLAFAEQTEFTKLSIDIQLILLFIQLVIDLVLAFVTFGASTGEGVLAAFITRLTVRGFLTELIKAVLMAVLPDVITQTVMLAEGHRSSFDVGETLQAAQMGVIGGLVGAGLGAGLGKLGTTEFLGSVAGKFLSEDASEFAGGVANAALHGALTNVGTNMVAGTADSVENQIHAAVDPVYAQELQQQIQDQGYADQKSGENPLIAALNGAFTGALFHTVHEGSFSLAGKAFDATPLTLTDGQGNTQQFTALPMRDGGGDYALFDENHQLVGKGTLGDNGAITVTPSNGSSYSAQVVTLGDKQFASADAPAAAADVSTHLAAEAPREQAPQQEPSAPGTDQPVPGQPVTSSDRIPGPGTPAHSAAPDPTVIQVDQQSAGSPEQSAEPPLESSPVQAGPQPPDVPATGTSVPTSSDVSPVTGPQLHPSATIEPTAPAPASPAADATTVPPVVDSSSVTVTPTGEPPSQFQLPSSGQPAGPAPGAGPVPYLAGTSGAAGLSSAPLEEPLIAPPGAGWFPLGAEHPEPGQPGPAGGTPSSPLTPQQVDNIAGTPTMPLSWDRVLVFTDTGEAMAYAERVWGDAISQLTPEQKAALMAYTGEAIVGSGDPPSYHAINRYLRGRIPPTPEILDSIARIDEALRLQPVPENVVVNRTTNTHAFTGPDGHPVEDPADLLGLVGSVHESPRYMSTHFGAYHPGGEEVALHLAVPEGTPALYLGTISVDPSQHELLLGRGLSFQVDRVWVERGEFGDDTWHVQAHVLPEHPSEPAYTRLEAAESPAGRRSPILDALLGASGAEHQHNAGQPVAEHDPVQEPPIPAGQQPGYATGHHGSVSPAQLSGSAHPADGGVRIAGPGDPVLDAGMRPIAVENTFVVEIHGADGRLFLDGRPVDLTAGDLPEQLRAMGWDGSRPVVLASCEAGLTGGAADRLAAALPGTDVIATDSLVWRDKNGNVVAASEEIFHGTLQPRLVEEDGHLTGDGKWQLHRAGAKTEDLPSGHPLNPTKTWLISREAEFTDLAGHGIWREGDHPSATALADEFGIPEQNQRRIQALVDSHKIAIDLRPSNPESARWLERGGVPKPEAIKAKTINQYDVMLAPDEATRAALAANVGAVGFFRPAEPVDTPALDPSGRQTHAQLVRTTESDALWAALRKRYASLMREYQANDEALSHLEDEGFFHVVNGVVYPYRAEIVNRLDVQLAPDEQARAVLQSSLRTPAYFRPAEPVETPKLDANGQPTHPQLVRTGESQGEWAALQKRYAQRLAEYLRVTDSPTGLLATGRAAVEDGVVKPFGLDPLPVPEGTPAVDPVLGPPVTGDHDMLNIRGLNDLQLPRMLTVTNTGTGASIRMFEFKDASGHLSWRALAPEGTALKVTDFDSGQWRLMSEIVDSLGNRSLQDYQPNPDAWFEQLANEPGREKWDIPPMPAESGEAIAGDMGIMHGATAYWTPKSDQEIRIYGDIMREFGRDGDLLIRFQAGQPPTLVHSDTPVISGLIEAPDVAGLIEGPHHNPILDALAGHAEPAGHMQELAAPPEHPEWNGKFHVSHGNLIVGADPELAKGAEQASSDDLLLLKAHGRDGQIYPGKDSAEPIDVTDPAFITMLAAAGLRPGRTIVLASCEAGLDGGAADRLAAALPGTTVIAADTAVWDDRQGGLFAASETVENGMPRPRLVADENGAYHPDGGWKAHRAGTKPAPLPESDPRHPAVPVQLDPAADYARLAGSRDSGYQGDRFGPRAPNSARAQVTDAFARHDPAPAIAVDADHAGHSLLGALDPARIMPPDAHPDPLNEGLREYARDLLDGASKKFQFKPFTDVLDRQQAWLERRTKLEDVVKDAENKVNDLQAKFDQSRTPDRGLSEEQKRAAMRERTTVEQQLKQAKSFLGHRKQELTNHIRYPNQKVKLNLDVHSIPVDGNWDKAWIDFHDGAGDYPSVSDRLVSLRGRTQNFDQRYAEAILDLATAPTGQPGIPKSLRDLAGALYGDQHVTDFLNNPDRAKWLDRNDPIGTFLHDAAALMTLQLFVEGERNRTALVTNLANWHMVAEGELSIEEALGYFNVMGPRGSVQVAKASYSLGDPAAQVPDGLRESVAEMEMRQRQILALYAIATREVPLKADASGVAALNAYFAQRDAIAKVMAALVQRLGW